MLPYNKLCNVSDFQMLAPDIADIFRHVDNPRLYRKFWEQAQQIRGLRDHGALHKDAWLLGVGAGVEVSNYHLANHAALVVATDLYSADGWTDYAPAAAIHDPVHFSPYGYRQDRLQVLDMDGRDLQFLDGTFDGIYSASSIEHFGTLDDIAQAMREMYRVLKPGGVIAFSTEYDINGRTGHLNSNTYIFNEDTLQDYVIVPSGCVLVDTPDRTVEADTRATSLDLGVVCVLAELDRVPSPHIVISSGGFEFLPVSIVLRKPE
jgi:SAM-dependent methyltransferase